MKKLALLSLLITVMFAAGLVTAQDSAADAVITLERTYCFGTCPVYKVSILADGTVIYEGTDFVDVEGEQTSTIDPETVKQMVAAFEDAGYFEWDESYTNQNATDLPSAITSVTRDGETHTITHYMGDFSAPIALPFLENWVDVMVNTSLWTGAQVNTANVLHNLESPIFTLQRDPCFGFCPVYTVTAFEDGTVVFTGIANVEKLGVQVLEKESFEVTNIAEIASLMGYFDWQDNYDYYIVTDQAYITTSLNWNEQYKQIVRYDGDPNAPIGLVRVEESINQLVADLITPTGQ